MVSAELGSACTAHADTPSFPRVQDAVEAWLDEQRIRPKLPVVDLLGSRPVQRITKADVEAALKALSDGKSPLRT